MQGFVYIGTKAKATLLKMGPQRIQFNVHIEQWQGSKKKIAFTCFSHFCVFALAQCKRTIMTFCLSRTPNNKVKLPSTLTLNVDTTSATTNLTVSHSGRRRWCHCCWRVKAYSHRVKTEAIANIFFDVCRLFCDLICLSFDIVCFCKSFHLVWVCP